VIARLAPSILRLDFRNLEETLAPVAEAADRLHLDICDGRFCPALTFGPDVVRAISEVTGLPLNLHLGMERPDLWFERFAAAGATWLSFHPATVPAPRDAIAAIRDAGAAPGLALLPDEDPCRYEELYLDLEVVISLNVLPGIQAQAPTVDPVARTRQVVAAVQGTGSTAEIEVDGGVTLELVRPLVDAGARSLAIGSGIFASEDAGAATARFRSELLAAG
jgi:ribulose-phosphate 3-epimerase